MSRFPNVLLDLDGTLTDPSEGIAASIRYALERLGREPPSLDHLLKAVGPPLRETFQEILETRDEQRIREAIHLYRERYSVRGLLENRVYPGLPDMLAELNAHGCRLYVATSKPGVYAKQIIHHFGLEKHFVKVYGSELDGSLENKAELIRFILQEEDLSPRATAMVGDRSHDVVGARNNRVCAVGVCWGYGSHEELHAAGADRICRSQSEVLRFLKES